MYSRNYLRRGRMTRYDIWKRKLRREWNEGKMDVADWIIVCGTSGLFVLASALIAVAGVMWNG